MSTAAKEEEKKTRKKPNSNNKRTETVAEVLLYIHRNLRLIKDGGAQDGHLDFHTAPDLTETDGRLNS